MRIWQLQTCQKLLHYIISYEVLKSKFHMRANNFSIPYFLNHLWNYLVIIFGSLEISIPTLPLEFGPSWSITFGCKGMIISISDKRLMEDGYERVKYVLFAWHTRLVKVVRQEVISWFSGLTFCSLSQALFCMKSYDSEF